MLLGDSAGGDLASAGELKLKQAGVAPPHFSIVISPSEDLECINRS